MGPISARLENGPCYIAGSLDSTEKRILETTDLISGRLEDETDVHIHIMLKPVRKILEESASLTEVRDRLAAAFPKMDVSDLGDLIAKAMGAADLLGRQEVMDGE